MSHKKCNDLVHCIEVVLLRENPIILNQFSILKLSSGKNNFKAKRLKTQHFGHVEIHRKNFYAW